MGRRMSEGDWAHVAGLTVLDDVAAHMIAEEFTRSWTTCWFADTGQFDHEVQTNGSIFSNAELMDRALFGWWMDGDDVTDPEAKSPRTLKVRGLMLAYLTAREVCKEMGPIEGFGKMWRADD